MWAGKGGDWAERGERRGSKEVGRPGGEGRGTKEGLRPQAEGREGRPWAENGPEKTREIYFNFSF